MRAPFLGASFVVVSAFQGPLCAQDFEVAKVQMAYYPSQSIEESSIDGKVGFFEWGVHFALPHALNENKHTILTHKIAYAQLQVATEAQWPQAVVESQQYYHTLIYDVGVVQRLDTNWRCVVNVIPTLASDFQAPLSADDLLLQFNTMLVRTSGKVKYGFGLAYTTRLGRQLILPLGLLQYNNKGLDLDMVLPNKLSIMYTSKASRFSYGLKAGVNGGVFNNTSEIQTVSNAIDEVGYSRLLLGPALGFQLKNSVHITLQGGVVVARRLELVDSEEQTTDRTPRTSAYIGIGLAYVLEKNRVEASLNP